MAPERGEIVKLLAIGRPPDEVDISQIARYAAAEMRAVAGLPLAAAGLIDFEVIELHAFSAIEVLFASQPQRAKAREGQGSE